MDDLTMLLRKVSVDPTTPVIVTDHCLTQVRKCYPKLKETKGRKLRAEILVKIRDAMTQDQVFENPKRKTQHIGFIHLCGVATWVILSPEEDVLVALSVRVHRDRDYAAELKEALEAQEDEGG